MRNNMYVSVTGSTQNGNIDQAFNGVDGVVCYVARRVPDGGGTMSNMLIGGSLGDQDFVALLMSVRETVGPLAFVKLALQSIAHRHVHKLEERKVTTP